MSKRISLHLYSLILAVVYLN